jgi:tripartite-type tricarboxylate transporter receptor subunit TctC
MGKLFTAAAALAAAFGLSAGLPAKADDVAEFYKGRTITIVVGFGAGGGFGLYSRALAEFMGEHVPGKPNIQPQFMPGAGGLKAANYFYNVSPRDGSVMAIMSQTGPLTQRMERGRESNIRHDFAKFHWLGRLVTMEAGFVGRNKSGLTTVDALKANKLNACAAGKAHQGYINAVSIAEALGLEMQVIVGYPSSSDQLLALAQGECNVVALSLSTWETTARHMIDNNEVTPLMVIHTERSKFWPDVPTTAELATDPDDKAVLNFIAGYAGMGRAYALPPETPVDRVEALRTAFVATYEDPAFIAAMEKRKMPMNPAPGPVVEKHVMDTLNASEAIVERTRRMLGYGDPKAVSR